MSRTRGARTASFEVKVAAVRLLRSGLPQAEVARAFRLSPSTVSRWWRLARTGGANALMRRPVTGRPRKLGERELGRVASIVRQRPSAAGVPGKRWTAAKVADLISRTYGVSYHPGHVWRVLRSLGVSLR